MISHSVSGWDQVAGTTASTTSSANMSALIEELGHGSALMHWHRTLFTTRRYSGAGRHHRLSQHETRIARIASVRLPRVNRGAVGKQPSSNFKHKPTRTPSLGAVNPQLRLLVAEYFLSMAPLREALRVRQLSSDAKSKSSTWGGEMDATWSVLRSAIYALCALSLLTGAFESWTVPPMAVSTSQKLS